MKGGNITYTKNVKEETDSALIRDVPHGLMKQCRIKSIEMDIPMKAIFIKLLKKFANGEIRI